MTYSNRLQENGVAIFLLHGVEDGIRTDVRNYTRKHIPRTDFIDILKDLNSHGTAVSMDDIVADRNGEKSLPPYSFAITFDDGFENNLSVAAPILDEMAIPSTFYVTSDFIDRNRMSWIDRIEYVIEQTPTGQLTLPWTNIRFSTADERKALLDDIRHHVKSTPSLIPDDVATSVQNQLDFPETWASDHPLDKKLTWHQVQELESGHGFSIGGHSHTHGILSFLNDADLRKEIDISLALLHEKAGLNVHHYSYPEGLAHCYDERVIALLKMKGIVCSPSAIDGVNGSNVDLFNLRRIMVM